MKFGKSSRVIFKAFLVGYLVGIGAALLLDIPFYRIFPHHQATVEAIAWKICPFIAFGLAYWPHPRWMLDVEIIALNGLLYALVVTSLVAVISLIKFVCHRFVSQSSGVQP